MKIFWMVFFMMGLGAVAAFADPDTATAFGDLAASGTNAETGTKATIESNKWYFAFIPFGVSAVTAWIAYKKAKENSDREDNTKELWMNTIFGLLLGLVGMVIVYGTFGSVVLGTDNFGDLWANLVSTWWKGALGL